MKHDFLIFENNTWKPSEYYDNNTRLKWVFSYKLFKKVYINRENNINRDNNRYAIHKDVYKAFLYKYKHLNNKTNKKTTRPNKKNHTKRRLNKY
tara:strand:+ start:5576 stop:5857 length:282 start_codon:yes stop_codon:yes gene_type:complete